jgi:hypothetical protein
VHRQDSNGIETYVVWERCKVPTKVAYPGVPFVRVCPDSDLMMAASADNGVTWQMGTVDDAAQDQFQAALSVDGSTNAVNIAYYSSQGDIFQHKLNVVVRQILPGAATPDPLGPPITVTSASIEPAADLVLQGIFIGHNLGITARQNHVYIHFMNTAVPGIYNGAPAPEQNNHLSRVDF